MQADLTPLTGCTIAQHCIQMVQKLVKLDPEKRKLPQFHCQYKLINNQKWFERNKTLLKQETFTVTVMDQTTNLVPRVSLLPVPWRERETLVGAGHVSPRIWEITNIYKLEGGVEE